MKKISTKLLGRDFIVGLIKDDLINLRLVAGLDSLGLESGNYHLRLHETIFTLMDIPEDEEFEVEYLNKCDEVRNTEIFQQPEQLDKLALNLYDKLVRKSNRKIDSKPGRGRN